MFRVRINSYVTIQGCPTSGLEAVEFRRAAGLPLEPRSSLKLDIEVTSESLCRRFPDLLNDDADIVTYFGSGAMDHHPVPPRVLAGIDPADPETLAPLLECCREAVLVRREREASKERERDERQARQDAEDARQKAAYQEGIDRMKRWADQHGSDLLKARIAEGFEFEGLASAEFGDHVAARLGFGPKVGIPDGYGEPTSKESKTPSLDDIRALRAARQRIADIDAPATAELQWMVYPVAVDEDGYPAEDAVPLKRNEVCVTVTTPTGDRRHFYHLPADILATA